MSTPFRDIEHVGFTRADVYSEGLSVSLGPFAQVHHSVQDISLNAEDQFGKRGRRILKMQPPQHAFFGNRVVLLTKIRVEPELFKIRSVKYLNEHAAGILADLRN